MTLGSSRRVLAVSLAVLVAFAAHASPVRAQQGTALTGTVVDSAGMPIAAALVFIDGTDLRTETDAAGAFQLDDVPPGRVRLSLRRAGYAARTFELDVPASGSQPMMLGAISLILGPLPDALITGAVSDAASGTELLGVGIAVNGSIVGFTRRDGTFRIEGVTVQWGGNVVGVRRIGYQPLFTDVDVTNPETEFQLDIQLHPLPIELPEVVVEEDRAVYQFGRMREFYRRQRQGRGVFITRRDIEVRAPRDVSDVLTGVPGVIVSPNERGQDLVSFQGGAFGSCRPRVWVDGFPLSLDMAFDNINQYVDPASVAGIEVYRRASEVPAEFSGGPGTGTCGALVIWTQ